MLNLMMVLMAMLVPTSLIKKSATHMADIPLTYESKMKSCDVLEMKKLLLANHCL